MSPDRSLPAEMQLGGPPQPDEGHVVTVEHDHADPRFLNGPHKECQECGAAVDRREPHTTAFIRVQSDLGPQHKRPAFCDAECWFAFATSRAGADE